MTTYVDRLRGCFSMLLAPQLAGTLSIFLHVLGVFEGFGPVGPKEPKVPKVPLGWDSSVDCWDKTFSR